MGLEVHLSAQKFVLLSLKLTLLSRSAKFFYKGSSVIPTHCLASLGSTPSMARTRGQARQEPNEESQKHNKTTQPESKKRSHSKVEHYMKETEAKQPATKKRKSGGSNLVENSVKSKTDNLLSKYGSLPLANLGLPNPSSSTPENVLALVYNAMLTSARISHELAHKSVKCLIEAGYQDIETLSKSTWQERTEVLTKGGYTRYREKTATALGDLADFVNDKYGKSYSQEYCFTMSCPISHGIEMYHLFTAYGNRSVDHTYLICPSIGGDLNKLLEKADTSAVQVRSLLKEIKGIGNVGTDIFCDTAQGIWPCLAPFIDPRSMKTAQQCGLGEDLNAIWETIDQDPERMCRLAAALTTVRLEKKEKEFA